MRKWRRGRFWIVDLNFATPSCRKFVWKSLMKPPGLSLMISKQCSRISFLIFASSVCTHNDAVTMSSHPSLWLLSTKVTALNHSRSPQRKPHFWMGQLHNLYDTQWSVWHHLVLPHDRFFNQKVSRFCNQFWPHSVHNFVKHFCFQTTVVLLRIMKHYGGMLAVIK